MASRRGDLQEINAGSMADIAFLLLVFFLVTTTMDSDWGIQRKLPPPPEEEPEDIDIKQRNVFVVLANANDQLLVENELMEVNELKSKAKEFILNASRSENLPEWTDITVALAKAEVEKHTASGNTDARKKWEERLEAAEVIGSYTLTKQVISLQNDRGTSYDLYIQVQNELAAAYRELRDELCMAKFGKSFNKLSEENDNLSKSKINAIKTVFPQKISEAEPKNIGGA